MASDPVKSAKRGLLAVLLAAFLFLGGFVFLVIAVVTPSPSRVFLAVPLLLAGFLFLRSGHAVLRQASQQGGRGEAEKVEKADEVEKAAGTSRRG